MLTMLVVDDEIYALKGITQGIEWDDLPISTILEADSVRAGIEQMGRHQVDIVISDIEMPGQNGLELLRWIHENYPDTITIFLTGHARFDYAREALQYNCFDYVLKPVDHDVLKGIIVRAVQEVMNRRQRQAFEERLEMHRRQWANQLPILVERFWQDLLSERIPHSPERLNRQFELYDIPLHAESSVLPVLISIEHWNVELNARDENIMEYAVRKAASEMILGDRPGTVLQDRGDLNVLLVYLTDGDAGCRKKFLERCHQYVMACHDFFHCRLSCYVGEPTPILELGAALDNLQQIERVNMSSMQSVIDIQSLETDSEVPPEFVLPPFAEWEQLLDSGRMDELSQAVTEFMRPFDEQAMNRETMELFYFGFVNMLYQAANRKGVSIHQALTMSDLNGGLASKTHQQMLVWALDLLDKAGEAFQGKQRDVSAIIAKIKSFIHENLHTEMSRDDIANSVYRNPAYISRLFRKETGMSLWDYITYAKIERAKQLLTDTNDKISNIVTELGYTHLSYFARLFKKMTGMTPQDYRKNHRKL